MLWQYVPAPIQRERYSGEIEAIRILLEKPNLSRSTATISIPYPVLSDAGDWDRANKVFEGKLGELVEAIDEAMAA